MFKKFDAGQALKMFVTELGVPEELTVDGSKEHNSPGTEFMRCCQMNGILLTKTEPEVPNQNPAEWVIREVQMRWFQTNIRRRVPRKLWDCGYQ